MSWSHIDHAIACSTIRSSFEGSEATAICLVYGGCALQDKISAPSPHLTWYAPLPHASHPAAIVSNLRRALGQLRLSDTAWAFALQRALRHAAAPCTCRHCRQEPPAPRAAVFAACKHSEQKSAPCTAVRAGCEWLRIVHRNANNHEVQLLSESDLICHRSRHGSYVPGWGRARAVHCGASGHCDEAAGLTTWGAQPAFKVTQASAGVVKTVAP